MLFKRSIPLILLAGFIPAINASNKLREQRKEETEKIIQSKLKEALKGYSDRTKEIGEKEVDVPLTGVRTTIFKLLDSGVIIAATKDIAKNKGFEFSEDNEFEPYEVVLIPRSKSKKYPKGGYTYGIFLSYHKPSQLNIVMVEPGKLKTITTEELGKYMPKEAE
jgi:hypothetical protein